MGLQDIGNFYLLKKTQMSNFCLKKWEFILSPCPNPEKLRQLYWDYEFFYRHPMAEPQYFEEEYGCEEKFVYDLAVSDRNQGRKKNLEDFKVWWERFLKRIVGQLKADDLIH